LAIVIKETMMMMVTNGTMNRTQKRMTMYGTMMNRILMMIALLCLGTGTMKATETCYIKQVVDGTTLVTEKGDTVKLIGVRPWNTESMSEKDLQDYLEILVGGVQVTMTEDKAVRSEGSVKFRYVSVGGTLVNQHLISEGYAEAATDVSFSRALSFASAAEAARIERLGRWAMEDQYAGVARGTLDDISEIKLDFYLQPSVDQVMSGVLE
jgi:endonuclease YncB( thermonuclease family)